MLPGSLLVMRTAGRSILHSKCGDREAEQIGEIVIIIQKVLPCARILTQPQLG